MPDRDFEKWKALSKYTGTEVIVYSDSHDPAAFVARVLGDIMDGLSKAGLTQAGSVENIVIRNPGQFEQQWEIACRAIDCNPHDRKPLPPSYHPAYKGITHSRLQYLRAMMKDGVLPKEGDVKILQANQDALIGAEAGRIFEDQLEKERRAIIAGTKKLQEFLADQRRAMRNVQVAAPLPSPLELAPVPARPALAPPSRTDWIADLKTLAISACDSGPTLSSEGLMAAEWYQLYGFENCNDNAVQRAETASTQLSGCEKIIFDRTIDMLRFRKPVFNGTQQLVNLVNAFRGEQPGTSSYSRVQRNASLSDGSRTRDRSNGTDDTQTRDADWNRRMKEIDARTKESLDRIYKQAQDDWERKKREQEAVDDFNGRGTGSPLFKDKK